VGRYVQPREQDCHVSTAGTKIEKWQVCKALLKTEIIVIRVIHYHFSFLFSSSACELLVMLLLSSQEKQNKEKLVERRRSSDAFDIKEHLGASGSRKSHFCQTALIR